MFEELYKTLLNTFDGINTKEEEELKENIDLSTKEGFDKINEIMDNLEKSPIATIVLSAMDLDLENLREAVKKYYENYKDNSKCDCECCKDKSDCGETCDCEYCQDNEDEFTDSPLRYINQVPKNQIETIQKLVDEYMGEMEVEYEEELSETNYRKLEKILTNFAAFILIK